MFEINIVIVYNGVVYVISYIYAIDLFNLIHNFRIKKHITDLCIIICMYHIMVFCSKIGQIWYQRKLMETCLTNRQHTEKRITQLVATLKIYTTLGYIVSLILSRMTHSADDAKAKHVSQVQED